MSVFGIGEIVGAIGKSFDQDRATAFNAWSAQEAYKHSKRSQERQMAFEERMSNTAHQREVEDLKKAGLNPLYSAMSGNGASTPGVSALGSPMAQSAWDGSVGDTLANSARAVRQEKLQQKSLELANQDVLSQIQQRHVENVNSSANAKAYQDLMKEQAYLAKAQWASLHMDNLIKRGTLKTRFDTAKHNANFENDISIFNDSPFGLMSYGVGQGLGLANSAASVKKGFDNKPIKGYNHFGQHGEFEYSRQFVR